LYNQTKPVKLTYVTEELYGERWFRFTEVAPASQKIFRKISPSIEIFIRHPIPQINTWGWSPLKVLVRHVRGKFLQEF